MFSLRDPHAGHWIDTGIGALLIANLSWEAHAVAARPRGEARLHHGDLIYNPDSI